MSRRSAGPWVVISLLIVSVALAGCGGAQSGGKQGQAPAVLRVSLTSDPSSLDPAQVAELYSGWVVANMYEGLVRRNAEGKIEGALAERWEVSPDATRYTFHLRKDVKFHSGNPVTAEDVKFSWERALKPETKGEMASYFLSDIQGADEIVQGKTTELSGVKVIDSHTLQVTLAKPSAEFLPKLSVESTFIVDRKTVESQDSRWFERLSAGTGPYKLSEWVHNDEIVLVANKDCWRGAPGLDKVEYHIVPQQDTSVAMYEAGELDFILVPEGQYQRIKQDPVLSKEMVEVPRAQIRYVGMNPNLYAPFQDVRVRQAFTMALDKKTYADTMYKGQMEVAYGILPPGFVGYNSGLKGLGFDPAQARELLAAAGYADGKGLPPLTLAFAGAADEPQWMAASWKQNLGVEVTLQRLERGELLGAMNKRQVAFFSFGWTADYMSPRTFLYDLLDSSSPMDRTGYKNERFDQLVDKAGITTDEESRLALYQQAEQLAVDDAALIWLWFPKYVYLVKPYVKGIVFTPISPLPYNSVRIEKSK